MCELTPFLSMEEEDAKADFLRHNQEVRNYVPPEKVSFGCYSMMFTSAVWQKLNIWLELGTT